MDLNSKLRPRLHPKLQYAFEALAGLYVTSILVIAASVFFLALAAHADPATATSRSRQPETATGSTKGNPRAARGKIINVGENGTDSSLLINITHGIMNDWENGNKPILGRTEEVEKLSLNLVQAANSYGIVEIEGERGSGKTGLVHELIILEGPQVFKLNIPLLNELRNSDELDMSKKLNQALQWLRARAKDVGSDRVILLLDDIGPLKAAQTIAPIDVILENLAQKDGFLTLIESGGSALSSEAVESIKKYPELKNSIIHQEILPPSYDLVLKHLETNMDKLRVISGREISLEALEEAARIKSTFFKTHGFKTAEDLVLQAAKVAEKIESKGGTRAAKIQAQENVNRLKRQAQLLTQELAARPNEARQAQLARVRLSLVNAEAELNNLGTDLGQKMQLVHLEMEIHALEKRQEELKAKIGRGLIPFVNAAEKDEKYANDNKIRELQLRKVGMENELSNVDTTKYVSSNHVLRVAAAWLNKPISQLTANFTEGLRNFDQLKSKIFGQDHVLDMIKDSLVVRDMHLNDGIEIKDLQVAEAVKRGYLEDAVRPVASYWFAGNTGVGKTATAIQLANLLGYEFFRFDMSEFKQAHMVARLIGSPVGYVGSDQEGELTGKVKKIPDCVILFDEIEKGNDAIYDLLLQILDAGQLTDARGNVVKFNRVIFIATSNLAQEIAKMQLPELMKIYNDSIPEIKAYIDGQMQSIQAELTEGKITQEEAQRQRNEIMKQVLGDGTLQGLLDNKTGKADLNKLRQAANERLINPATGKVDINRLRSEVYKSVITDAEEMGKRGLRAIRREIIARFDNLVVFNDIDETTALKIFKKNLSELMDRLKYFYDIQLSFSPEAYDRISERFKTAEGGRSMRRVVTDILAAPIANLLWDKKVNVGDRLVVDVDDKGAYSRTAVSKAAFEEIKKQSESDKAPKSTANEFTNQLDSLNKANTGGKVKKGAVLTGELVRAVEHPEYVLEPHFMRRFRAGRK